MHFQLLSEDCKTVRLRCAVGDFHSFVSNFSMVAGICSDKCSEKSEADGFISRYSLN